MSEYKDGQKVFYWDKQNKQRKGTVVGQYLTEHGIFSCLMTVVQDDETGEQVERQVLDKIP